jgi:uncharacterized SAM-binding protein YcdF (DUF218 family)
MPLRVLKRGLGRAAWSFAALASLWFGGFLWFVESLPRASAIEDAAALQALDATDAIVVLTGGQGRLQAGLALLRHERARKLFVSGVYRGVDVNELMQLARAAPQEIECCIVLGYAAADTRGNAAETADWMRREGFTSLRLVTADYHMPRARLAFAAALPGVRLETFPVTPALMREGAWWQTERVARLLVGEYSKLLLSLPAAALTRLTA